jgi:ferritin-like metal-binding protein YciE
VTQLSSAVTTMQDLLLHGLRDIAYAENRTLRMLPKMIGRATNHDLKETLHAHEAATKKQIKRLALVFDRLGEPFEAHDSSPAIDGLAIEAEGENSERADKSVVDAAILDTAHAIKHLAIARYSSLVAWAKELRLNEIIRLLTTNLNEEKTANSRLNAVHLNKLDLQRELRLKVAS